MGNYFWYDQLNSVRPRTCTAGLRVPRRVYELPRIARSGRQLASDRPTLPMIEEKKGFIANYKHQLLLSAAGLLVTAVVAALGHMGNAPPTLAFAALPLLFFSVIFVVWPFHCYFRYRTMMALATVPEHDGIGRSDISTSGCNSGV